MTMRNTEVNVIRKKKPKTSKPEPTLQVAVRLKGDDISKFLLFKKLRHIKVDALALRLMVREIYDELKKEMERQKKISEIMNKEMNNEK